VKWIQSMDKHGAPQRPSAVTDMANLLICSHRDGTLQRVGQNWVYHFVKRHDTLKSQFSRHYDRQRAKTEDPKIIREWFDRVQATVMEYGILPEDIYNFDETGFTMGLISTARVITHADVEGRPSLVQPGNHKWVTSIEAINATGWALPAALIFKAATHSEKWYHWLPSSWRCYTSKNGWTTDAIGLKWLSQLFIPAIQGRQVGKYVMLVMDGHGSHLTPEFDQLSREHDIIPICMPPHSSHLHQPLDVVCFAPLKHAYGSLLEQLGQLNKHHIDKMDFLHLYPQARKDSIHVQNIQSAFSATGLVPLDPAWVLAKLNVQVDHDRTPTPPGSQHSRSSAFMPETPHTTVALRRQATAIKRLIRRGETPPTPTRNAINQLVKGCQLAMQGAEILARENRELREAVGYEKKK
ncbi:MAG TPA: transposase, partial [Ktedonobacteraceae bacterium]|nr:transposase [Ktedonobacteraceae bacterium]